MTVPLAQDTTVKFVKQGLHEIGRKSKRELLHLSDFLDVSPHANYPAWKVALGSRERFYEKSPALPETAAGVKLCQKLRSQLKDEMGWRRLMNGLGKVHVEGNVKTTAKRSSSTAVAADAFSFLVDQAAAAGSPDSKELVAWLLEQYGVDVGSGQQGRHPDHRSAFEAERKRVEELQRQQQQISVELEAQEKAREAALARERTEQERLQAARRKSDEQARCRARKQQESRDREAREIEALRQRETARRARAPQQPAFNAYDQQDMFESVARGISKTIWFFVFLKFAGGIVFAIFMFFFLFSI